MVDESDVLAARGTTNDDLGALINTDLPGRDLDLGVWKLLAVAAFSFTGVPALLEYLVSSKVTLCSACYKLNVSSVSDVSSKCCKCFILMLQK